TLAVADSSASVAVKLNGMNGAIADGFMGWSNFNIAGGGDFGISMVDGTTCGGATTNGFDNHNAGYQMLNCGCQRHYLYSYSAGNADSDGAYQASTTLGGWNATAGCTSTEGGGIAFYAAMRRHLAAPAT